MDLECEYCLVHIQHASFYYACNQFNSVFSDPDVLISVSSIIFSLPPSWNEKAVVDSQLIFQPLFEILNLILFEYSSVVYCQELPSSHHINQSIGWWLFCNKMKKIVQSSIRQVCGLTINSKYKLKSF